MGGAAISLETNVRLFAMMFLSEKESMYFTKENHLWQS